MRSYTLILLLLICLNLSSLIINIPNDYTEIQQGINACPEGDTVLIEPGTYEEKIRFIGNDIVVGSRYILTQDTTYISQTIIKGDSSTGKMVTFYNDESNDAKLIGLTIKNGYLYGSQRDNFSGSGIFIDSSSPTISNNIIENNSCRWYISGAGIGIENSSAIIQNNIIRNNDGAFKGSGIYVQYSENIIIKDNIIHGNITCSGNGVAFGAGIFLMESEHTLIKNNLFYDNVIDCGWGGAISIKDGSCIIMNNTFTENNSDFGGTIHFSENSDVIIYNNIIWNNLPFDDLSILGEPSSLIYNNIQDDFSGMGNISQNPLFLSPEENDFSLTLHSPCINSGSPESLFDPDSSIVDMGYKYFDMSNYGRITGNVSKNNDFGNIQEVVICYGDDEVSPDENGNYYINLIPGIYDLTATLDYFAPLTISNLDVLEGQTLSNINFDLFILPINKRIEINQSGNGDFLHIQNAINSALDGDTLIVHPGTYTENLNLYSKNLILASKYYTSNDTSFISQTIIDGDYSNHTITLSRTNNFIPEIIGFSIINASENCFGVSCFSGSVLIGNCIISSPGSNGIYARSSSDVIIKDCKLYNNGTAIEIMDSDSIKIIDCEIYDNSIGANLKNSFLELSDNLMVRNHAAIKEKECYSTILSNTFSDNYTTYFCMDSYPTFTNNKIVNSNFALKLNRCSDALIINNLITDTETFIKVFETNAFLVNNTINNTFYFIDGSNSILEIINSIIWDYSIFFSSDEELNISISYSNLQGDFPETAIDAGNNISINPQFQDNTDYRLTSFSPCINAGNPDTTGLDLPENDLDGNPRIYDQLIDMGCYEYNPTSIENHDINSFDYSLKSYPNPFIPDKSSREKNISISFFIPEKSKIRIDIYNIKGQKIRNLLEDKLNKGNHQISWNGRNDSNKEVASGIYFTRLAINDSKKITKKMIILR